MDYVIAVAIIIIAGYFIWGRRSSGGSASDSEPQTGGGVAPRDPESGDNNPSRGTELL
jgi:hypothetical protein